MGKIDSFAAKMCQYKGELLETYSTLLFRDISK